MYLETMSDEERAESLRIALEKRREKIAFNLANEHKYKLEYLDSGHWQALATKHKLRMPKYNEPASRKGIRKCLNKLKLELSVWVEHYGKLDDWLERNPTFTQYAANGHALELKEEYIK